MKVNHSDATLDPPGSVAVIGAGPLGIEAALYGRFLGYKVTVFEAESVASSWSDDTDEPIPMMPDRCVSPLARSAIDAQQARSGPQSAPLTVGEWIDRIWEPLAETDLLRGRVCCPARVTEIAHVVPEGIDGEDEPPTPEDAADGEPGLGSAPIEPDFRVTREDGQFDIFEAVILSTGADADEITLRWDDSVQGPDVDYLFQIGWGTTGDPESDFWAGLKQIVSVFAGLRGRPDLDLYRPLRG